LTELDVSKCLKLKVIYCGDNCLKSLNCQNNTEIAGIICWVNEITDINITGLSNLECLGCGVNLLTKIDFSQSREKLRLLDIADNNFPKQNLEFLRGLTNVEKLLIGNNKKGRIGKEKVRNRFSGSLEPLKDMKKLQFCNIDGIDAKDEEFLPSQVKRLKLFAPDRPNLLNENSFDGGSEGIISAASNAIPLLFSSNLSDLRVGLKLIKEIKEEYLERTEEMEEEAEKSLQSRMEVPPKNY